MRGCTGFDYRTTLLSALACAGLLVSGCQRAAVPVTGKVTLNGKPLVGAVVTFQPRGTRDVPPDATGSVGRTDNEGHFSLRMLAPDQRGAIPGRHTVTISTSANGDSGKALSLPGEWRDGSKEFIVPKSGTSEANFDMRSAPLPPAGKGKNSRPVN
jgi:hypothetical protein